MCFVSGHCLVVRPCLSVLVQVRFLEYIRQWRKKVVFVLNKVDTLGSMVSHTHPWGVAHPWLIFHIAHHCLHHCLDIFMGWALPVSL